MIHGIVNDQLEAIVPVTLMTPAGPAIELAAIIDTGYNGCLAIPRSFAQSIGLPAIAPRNVTLGDGSLQILDYFTGQIRWNGQVRRIRILATKDEFLLGTALLEDLRLEATFRPGERVTISPA